MGYLYLIGCEYAFKVGFTGDLEERLGTLQAMSPIRLEVFGHWYAFRARDFERELHAALASYRSHGEWFMAAARPQAESAVEALVAEGLLYEVSPQVAEHLRLAFALRRVARRCRLDPPTVSWDESGARQVRQDVPMSWRAAAAVAGVTAAEVETTVLALCGRLLDRVAVPEVSPLLDQAASMLELEDETATIARIRDVIESAG